MVACKCYKEKERKTGCCLGGLMVWLINVFCHFMFFCANNSTCIHNDIVCDGYEHCPDGSDEEENMCSQCPRTIGYPPDKLTKATFACKHRYTQKWICAVPCDDEDDLCMDNVDENCNQGSKYTSMFAGILLLLILTLGELFLKNFKGIKQSELEMNDLLFIKNKSSPFCILIKEMNASSCDKNILKSKKARHQQSLKCRLTFLETSQV